MQKAYVSVSRLNCLILIFRDSYTSLKIIRRNYLRAQIQVLSDKKSQSTKDKAALKKLQEELAPIEEFLSDAKKQREAIAKEIASLQHDNTKCVIIVDFTKWGLVVNGNVHCFVMCVLFGEEKKPSMLLTCFVSDLIVDELRWKPSIKYFDFFAQSTKDNNVRQVFPFVKVCVLG